MDIDKLNSLLNNKKKREDSSAKKRVFAQDYINQLKALGDSEKTFIESQNNYMDNWNDDAGLESHQTKSAKYYDQVNSFRNTLLKNANIYREILGDKSYSKTYNSLGDILKNKDNADKYITSRSELYKKYQNADEYNKAKKQAGFNRKYSKIKTFKDYQKNANTKGEILEKLPKDEQDYLKQLGFYLEYSELYTALNGMKERKATLEKNLSTPQEYRNSSNWAQSQRDLKLLNTNIKNAESRLSELNSMGGVYAGITNQILANNGEIAFDLRWAGTKKAYEDYKKEAEEKARFDKMALKGEYYTPRPDEMTPEEKNKALSGQKVQRKREDKYALEIDPIFADSRFNGEGVPEILEYYATPEEKEIHAYLKKTKGEGVARHYLEELKVAKLDKRLNQAIFDAEYEYGSKNPFTASIASVGYNLLSGIEMLGQINNPYYQNHRSIYATKAQGQREGVKSQIDSDGWDTVYDWVMSSADSVTASLLSGNNKLLQDFLIGSSAAASTYSDALNRGVSHADALNTSMIAGVAEGTFEHFSLGRMFDISDITKGFTKAGLKQVAKKVATDMFVNFSEESLTEISNIVADQMINGELSNYATSVRNYMSQGLSEEEAKKKAASDVATQIGEAGLSGMLMGAGFGMVGSVRGMKHSQMLNSRSGSIIKQNGSLTELKELANNSGVVEIQKAAEKLTPTSKASKIGSVYNSLIENAVDNSVKQMTPILLKNGATKSGSNSAEGWARQIATSVLDNTSNDRHLYTNNVTKNVYTDFTENGKYGSNEIIALRDMTDTENRSNKFGPGYVTQEGNIINERGIEVPMTADGRAAVGSKQEIEQNINQAINRKSAINSQIRAEHRPTFGTNELPASLVQRGPITNIFKQNVANKLEAERPSPKAKTEADVQAEKQAYFDKYFAKEKQITPEEEEHLKEFGESKGLEVEFVDGAVNDIGYGVFKNGKKIVISRYAKQPMRILFKHEFTHSVENAKGYKSFQEYVLKESEAFKEWLATKGFEDSSAAIKDMMERYKGKVDYNKVDKESDNKVDTEDTNTDNKKDNNYEKAKADVIADFVGEVLFGKNIDKNRNPIKIDTNFLVELKRKDRNLFNRFVEWVHSIFQRLKASGVVNKDIIKLEQKFKRLAEQSVKEREKAEGKQITTNKVEKAKTQKVEKQKAESVEDEKPKPERPRRTDKKSLSYKPQFADVAEAMAETDGQYSLADNVNEAAQKVAVEYDAETESVAPQYSLASWEDSSYVKDRNNAAQKIADAIGVSKRTAIKYIDSINSIAKVIADDRVRLDYDPATGKTSFVSNVEYGGSIDFSTLCQKRKWLTGTFSAIQRELKNSALTASEVLKIRNMLKEKGIEVSCGLCYVEGSRAEMGVFAKQFIERYKKRNPEYIPDMADVNTPEGVEALRINHPEVYEAYEEFWNNKGVLNEGESVLFASQRKPKLYSVRTDYKHEILDKFKNEDNVNEKNKNGGLRIQSFSDFEIVHLIDMMQVIMDMSQVGLAGQAYTKVADFALALGDTGLKINLSLIAKGIDADGNLIFDDVEGMPIDTAMRIRKMYSKNVGTILVIFNDAQLKAALKDDRVDFIIPFHRSQWKRSQYAELGLPKDTKDYTYMQNERYIKPVYYTTRKGTQGKRKATNYMPNDYWDFNKSGKENAENYLKLCAENNKRPKFYKLLVDNKDGSYSLQPDGSTDGYWKLLIDFKMYDNNGKGSPQTPVKPTFNMEESMRMLEEYKGDHASFPADQETVDAFVKEYKSKHKLDNFTESNRGKIEVKDDYDVGSYSLPDLDTDYLKAVENGDMETAQRMVDEAAKKSRAILDEEGNPIKLYRGTKGGQTIFAKETTLDGKVYTISNLSIATKYGDKTGKTTEIFKQTKGEKSTYALYGFPKNMLTIDAGYGVWSDLVVPEELLKYSNGKYKATNAEISKWAEQEGYDALRINNVRDGSFNAGDEIIFFDENLVKSADAITKDNDGNVIPLSERFNTENADIRYSLPEIPSDSEISKTDFEDIADKIYDTISKKKDGTKRTSIQGTIKYKDYYVYIYYWSQATAGCTITIKKDGKDIDIVREKGYISKERAFYLAAESIAKKELKLNNTKVVREPKPKTNKKTSTEKITIPEIARGKSNEELNRLIEEGKITTDDAFNSLRAEHGTMPKGESPKVDVTVPNKVSEKQGVRRFARTALESGHLTDGMSEEAKREILDGALNYKILSNNMLVNMAENEVKNDINKAIKKWEDLVESGRMPTAKEIVLGEVLMVEAAKAGNANDVAMYLAELSAMGTELGQGIQALSLLKKLSGVGQLHYVSRVIAQLNEDLKSRYGDKYLDKMVKLNPYQEKMLAESKNESEIESIIDDILTDVARQLPSTWRDKLNAWRYLAMLGNVKTHIRNFLGNGVFIPAIRLKNTLASVAEKIIIRDEANRTKSFKLKKEYKDFAEADFKNVEDLISKGGKMSPSSIVDERRKIFTSKAFAWAEKARQFNFNMLEKEDMYFLQHHYKVALASVLQSRGLDLNNITDEQLQSARNYAIKEAQKATYRDFSYFANMLNKLANPNKNGNGWDALRAVGGVLVEGAVPFKKTPINVLKRGVEYSPIGIATSLANSIRPFRDAFALKKTAEAELAKNNEDKANEYFEMARIKNGEAWSGLIDGLSASASGTMILGLGMFLQAIGWITGGLGYDDDDALERMSGAQPYAITLGDVSLTIDWMAPSSLPLLIGAEIQKANEEAENFNFFDALATIGEPMTELSFLQGISDVIDGIAYSGEDSLGTMGEVATNLASSYLSQYIPTLSGQTARTIDDTRRTNFIDKDSIVPKSIQKVWQKTLGKIPFAANEKVPYIDAWGKVDKEDNALLRAFENFLSPTYISKIEDDKVNKELAKVYADTKDSGIIPKRASTSFSINGVTKNLTPEEYVKYATNRGQYSRQYVETVMGNSMYKGLSSENKAEAISFLLSFANAKAKSDVSDYDYTSVSTYKSAAKFEMAGIDVTSYAIAKAAMRKENADTDGSGSVDKDERKEALEKAGFNRRERNKFLDIYYSNYEDILDDYGE